MRAKVAGSNLRGGSEALLGAALGSMPYGFSVWDEDLKLLLFNHHYLEIYGFLAKEVRLGMTLREICALTIAHGNQVNITADDLYARYLARFEGVADPTEARRYLKDIKGRTIRSTHVRTPGVGWVVTHEDVTAEVSQLQRAQARELEFGLQNMRFNAAVNNMNQGLCMFDKAERLVVCNTPYATIYNLPAELTQPGTPFDQIIAYRFSHGMVPVGGKKAYVETRKRLIADGVFSRDIIEMEDGRAILIQQQTMLDGGWVATHEDVTEQRQIEARMQHLARHDALTDLPNRMAFREEMARLEARIRRGETVAIICIDLDRFKGVNDTLGHGVGDQVLELVAARLRDAARETDVIARLGGDEFAFLVGALTSPRDAAVIAERITRLLAEPMLIDGHHVAIGASLGIAMAPGDGKDAETLLKNADLALYRAKGEGRGMYHFFEPGMDEAQQRRRSLEQGLRQALAGGELRLVYQPLLSLADDRICCLEALLRWDHPELGAISPSEFIGVAEETGMIGRIGDWVLREACMAAVQWPAHVRVAVNLSTVQFKQRGLVEGVVSALAAAGLPADRLELEITESLMLADTESTLQALHRLRALGVRISMDDFGTGFSSLSYLRSFPFDKIKIDRSFIKGLSPDNDSMAIIKAVIGLGRSLGMATTAEGIETEEQLAVVRDEGCNEVQGFLFSPPLPPGAIQNLFEAESGPRLRSAPAGRSRASG